MSANQTDATDAAAGGMLPRLGAWSRQTYGAGAVVESVRSLGRHSAVVERDGPFGDYSQGTSKPDKTHVVALPTRQK